MLAVVQDSQFLLLLCLTPSKMASIQDQGNTCTLGHDTSGNLVH